MLHKVTTNNFTMYVNDKMLEEMHKELKRNIERWPIHQHSTRLIYPIKNIEFKKLK